MILLVHLYHPLPRTGYAFVVKVCFHLKLCFLGVFKLPDTAHDQRRLLIFMHLQ